MCLKAYVSSSLIKSGTISSSSLSCLLNKICIGFICLKRQYVERVENDAFNCLSTRSEPFQFELFGRQVLPGPASRSSCESSSAHGIKEGEHCLGGKSCQDLPLDPRANLQAPMASKKVSTALLIGLNLVSYLMPSSNM